MKKIVNIILLITIAAVGYSESLVRTITVIGEGELSIKPDCVVISTGVNSANPVIGEALEENSAIMASIFAGLEELGISKDNIQTSNYNVYLYKPYKDDYDKQEVYRVSNSINIDVKDLDLVDSVLDRLVTLGANKINGIYFTFEDNEKFQNNLRKKAIENAREEAEFLAELEGMKVIGVISITEKGVSFPPEGRNYEYALASPMAKGSIAPGNETISASYTVVYQIKSK